MEGQPACVDFLCGGGGGSQEPEAPSVATTPLFEDARVRLRAHDRCLRVRHSPCLRGHHVWRVRIQRVHGRRRRRCSRMGVCLHARSRCPRIRHDRRLCVHGRRRRVLGPHPWPASLCPWPAAARPGPASLAGSDTSWGRSCLPDEEVSVVSSLPQFFCDSLGRCATEEAGLFSSKIHRQRTPWYMGLKLCALL